MKRRLVLIDGHAILHRAYHALPKTLINRHGQLVNAVYGFTRMLLKVIADLGPQYLVVAFDRPEPTFRHQEYVGYQVQRPKMDEELKGQIEIVKQVLTAFNIPIFEKSGFEADDIIGTLAKQVKITNVKCQMSNVKSKSKNLKLKKKRQIETIIVTGDRDIFQLINKGTLVYVPIKGFTFSEMFDRKKAKQSLGIYPEQVVDYKALVGDSSDNYPGVSGIGPKTAVTLLSRFKSLEMIYKNLRKIPESVREKLITSQESAFLSRKLAQIVTNVPVKLKLVDCWLADYDREKVLTLFKELGFRSLLDKLPGEEEKEEKKDSKSGEQMKLVLKN